MPGKRTMTIQTQTPGGQKPPTRAPEVGDWIKFRDWGSESTVTSPDLTQFLRFASRSVPDDPA